MKTDIDLNYLLQKFDETLKPYQASLQNLEEYLEPHCDIKDFPVFGDFLIFLHNRIRDHVHQLEKQKNIS